MRELGRQGSTQRGVLLGVFKFLGIIIRRIAGANPLVSRDYGVNGGDEIPFGYESRGRMFESCRVYH